MCERHEDTPPETMNEVLDLMEALKKALEEREPKPEPTPSKDGEP